MTITLTGQGLTLEAVAAIADGAPVVVGPKGIEAMALARARLTAAQDQGHAIYGVTTGLGPRAVERLSAAEQTRMSVSTLRGRAHSVGQPLPSRVVRAMMAVRLNTLLIGAAGADPALAHAICAALNAGVTPVVRETGSIGAGDLMWGAQIGLGLIGEGQMRGPASEGAAETMLATAGLAPFVPGPRDGLALAASSAPVAGLAALAVCRIGQTYAAAQLSSALSFEGFRANVSPLVPAVISMRPQPGQAAAAKGLLTHLHESPLLEPSAARRVQDPLSFRNVAQIHGAVWAALDHARQAVEIEINAASDNPVVLVDGRVLSSGGFLTPHMAISLTALGLACTHMAAAQVARMAKMVMPRFSDLPTGLVPGDTDAAGLAPAMKSAEALHAEIAQLAQPAQPYPGGAADGVEDVVTHSAVPAKGLISIADRLDRLTAMELMFAVQAVDLRGIALGPAMARTRATVRDSVAFLTEDQPMGEAIEALAERVATGAFSNV